MASSGSGNMTAAKRGLDQKYLFLFMFLTKTLISIAETLKKMEVVLRRFKVHEIEKYLYHHFTEKSWDDILSEFSESETSVDIRNIAHFFCKSVRQMDATKLFELGEICLVFGRFGTYCM
jgi:hypothetical protein